MQKSYKPNLLLCPLSIAFRNQNQVITVCHTVPVLVLITTHISSFINIQSQVLLNKLLASSKWSQGTIPWLRKPRREQMQLISHSIYFLNHLYDLDANPHMWMIDAIPTDASQLPPYIADGNVQCGIASLLVQDHVKEEIFRLQEEHGSMIKWLDIRIHHLKTTIMQCHGIYSSFLCGNQGPLEYKDKG